MPAIPLYIWLTPFAEKGTAEPLSWNAASATEAIEIVNGIWQQANVQFMAKEMKEDQPIDIAKDARANDRRLLDTLSYRRPAGGSVHVFLINSVPGLNAGGASYLDSDPEAATFVQWYGKPAANGRALAHELGHLLSLDHLMVDYTQERRAAKQITNLMVEGLTTGTALLPDQIKAAKSSKLAKRFGT